MSSQSVCLLLMTLLSLSSAVQTIGTYNLLLDPGRITSWTTKWVSTQIQLSQANQDATGVSVTFFINLSNSISGGVFEVTFPVGFDLSGVQKGASVSGRVVQVPATIQAYQDTTVVISGLTNPSVLGPYGPFALRTRMTSTGQVLDANLHFGNVYITSTEGKLTTSSVAYVSGSSIINRVSNTLSFKFTIGQSLWAHDIFRITVASQFAVFNPVCASVDYPGMWNNFNGTSISNPHGLDCVVTSPSAGKQVLWIYGLNNDVDVQTPGNRYVNLQVSGFTNPDRDYPDSAYVWLIQTVRFNTPNVLEAGTATGPNTVPDTILAYSWKPSWGRPVTSILPGQTLYMDTSFTTVNPIPAGGYVTIATNMNTATWGTGYGCYVVSYLFTGITCTQVSGLTTITGLGRLPAGASLRIRTLTVFSVFNTSPLLTSIFTRSAETWAIDTNSNIAGFSVPSSAVATPITFNVLLQTSGQTTANSAGGTGDVTQYIKFQIQGASFTPGTSRVTVSCPLTSVADDWQFGIPVKSANLQLQYKTTGTTADFSVGTVSNFISGTATNVVPGTTGSALTITSGSVLPDTTGAFVLTAGTVTFLVGTPQQSTDLTIGISVTGLTGLSQVVNSGAIILPRIATNPTTAYECAVDIIDSASKVLPARGVSQFSISLQSFDAASNGFTYFCARGNLPGAPVRVSFLPSVVDIYQNTGTNTYYVDIELPTNTYFTYVAGTSTFHQSGIAEGGTYPMDTNLSINPKMTVTNDGGVNSFMHRVTGLGDVSPFSTIPVQIFFPVGIAKSTNPVIQLHSFYIRTVDPRFKHYTHATTMPGTTYTIDTTNASNGIAFTDASISVGNNQINGNSMGTNPLGFLMKIGTAITGDAYFYIVFPRGYSFSSLKNVLSNYPIIGTGFAFIKYFSATAPNFAFPGVLVKASVNGPRISATVDSLISVIGVNTPLGSQSTSVFFVHGDRTTTLSNACAYSYTGTLTSIIGTITSITVSPNVVRGRGPLGADVTHTIYFTLPHGIDQGGMIVFSLNSAWGTTPATTCTVSGLNNLSSTSLVTCGFNGNAFTITNFLDFSTVTATSVTVILRHLLPPMLDYREDAVTMQLLDASGLLTSYSSAALGSAAIDSYVLTPSTLVTVIPSYQPGLTNFVTIDVQPGNAGTVDNDLYLRLSFPYNLPVWSVISVTVPYPALNPGNDIKNRCWLSPLRYYSCSLASGAFTVTLQDAYQSPEVIELFIDHAVNAPSEVTPPTVGMQYVFKGKVTWFGAVIIDDGVATYRQSQVVVPRRKLIGGITTGLMPLSFTPRNAGEYAIYTLSFQTSLPVATSDFIYVIWPDDFDPYLGDAEESYETENGDFYVSCSSQQFGTLYCRMDHWTLVAFGTNEVPASTGITIQVLDVKNPAAGATTANLKIFHVDSTGSLLEYNSAFGQVTPTALAANLNLKTISVSNRQLSSSADYTFQFYVSDTFTKSTQLWVSFPAEFDLQLVDQQSGYSCSTFVVDQTPGAANISPHVWNPSTACLTSQNYVHMPAASVTSIFTATDAITLTLNNVMTPQWGETRTPLSSTSDFDDWDWNIWTVWSWWTSQFEIFVYQGATSAQVYSSRPYEMLNAGYLGFLQGLRTISVNGYNPQDKSNRIIVYPGTQTSDVMITTVNSTVPLEAKFITFTAATNSRTPDGGLLKYTSFEDNWVMLQDEWSIQFRVAADKNLAKGLYYISWTLDEKSQPGVTSPLYCEPPITLVEVPAAVTGIYTFNVDSVPPVAIGANSIPVLVSISNPPHTDVSVNLSLEDNPTTVSVTPQTLVFKPDIDSLYFYINVSEGHNLQLFPVAIVLFSLSGTDVNPYSIAPALVIEIEERYVEVAGNVASLGISNVTRTSFSMLPSTDQLGVIYYNVAPKGAAILTFEQIKSTLPTFVYTSADYVSNQTNNAYMRLSAESDSDPPANTTWYDFRHRLFARHMATLSITGGIMMLTTSQLDPIVISGLWAGSEYQVVAYLDTLNPSYQASSIILEYVETLPVADCQPVAVTFTGPVSSQVASSLSQILAKHMGVNPGRVVQAGYSTLNSTTQVSTNSTNTTTTSNVVLSTTFAYTLLANRALNSPTPTDLATFNNEVLNNFYRDVVSILKLNVASYGLTSIPTRIEPIWKPAPSLYLNTSTTVTVQYGSSPMNRTCCVALEDTNENLLPDQVMEGYSYNWTQVPSACVSPSLNSAINYVRILYLVPDTTYYVHCVAADSYPLWPTLMAYNPTVPIPYVPVHTALTDETTSMTATGGALLQVTIAGIWLLIN